MSAPHVAGGVALLLQAHPDWPNWVVKSALMSTANDLGYDAWTQGTGRINLTRAANSQLATAPQSIDFGRNDSMLVWKELTIANLNSSSPIPVSLTATNASKLGTGESFGIASFNETSFSIPPSSNRTVNFSLDLSAAQGILSGYIIINKTDTNETYRVAYGVFASQCGIVNQSLTLTGDAISSGSCFNITASDVILDCAGYDVRPLSTGDYGVYASNVSNITVRNCNIWDFDHGVLFENVTNSLVENVNVYNATWYGFLQTSSSNNTFNNINASDQLVGFASWYGNSTNLSNSYFANDIVGANIFWERWDYMDNNTLIGSAYDLLIGNTVLLYFFPLHFGVYPQFYMHNITETNTVEGLPVRYIIGAQDYVFPENTGFAAFVDSRNVTAENLTLSHVEGLIIVNSTDSLVRNITFNSMFNGIEAGNSSNITISESTFFNSTEAGVEVHNASVAVLSNNASLNYGIDVLLMEDVSGTLVADNLFSGAISSIFASYVIGNAMVANNTINDSLYAIYIYYSNSSLFANNTIHNSALYGIYLFHSNNNLFYNDSLQDSEEVLILVSAGNNFSMLTVNNSLSYGVRFFGSSGNIISESLILNSSFADVYSAGSSSNLVINSTGFNYSSVAFEDNSSVLGVGWWARANVTNETGDPQDAALVYVLNNSGGAVAASSTNSSGLTPFIPVPELVITNSSATNATPHKFIAIKSSYSGSNTANITQDLQVDVVLSSSPAAWCTVPLLTNLTLDGDIQYNDSCILIDAPGVVLDCNGHSITGNGTPGTKGVRVNGRDNITIKNCIIGGYEIALSLDHNATLGAWSDYPTITNNTLANSSAGMFSDGAWFGVLENNTFYNNTDGMDLAWALYWDLFNNSFDENTVGARLYSDSSGNNLTSGHFSNNYVGVHFSSSYNNTIADSSFSLNAFDIASSASANSLVNSSFNASTLNFTDNASSLTAYWYARAFVNSTTGITLEGANVTARDSFGSIADSQLTNASGFTEWRMLKEVIYSLPANISFSPYNFTASYPGMEAATRSIDLNASQTAELTLLSCGTNLTENRTLSGNLSFASGPPSPGCILIDADDVAIDCNGHSIVGNNTPGTNGVMANGRNNITIRNCVIHGFGAGIAISGSGAVAENNTLYNNAVGLNATNAIASTISSNSAFNNTDGIMLNSTNNTAILGNTANNNTNGVVLAFSNENIIQRNTASSNSYYGFLLINSTNNTLANNTAQNNALDGFYLTPPSLNLLADNTASGNRDGFSLNSTGDESLIGNDALQNARHGFLVFNSTGINLTDNAASGNGGNGFMVENSSGVLMASNDALNNAGYGVYITNSTGVAYTDGRICGNGVYDDSGSTFSGNDLLCIQLGRRKRKAAYAELEIDAKCAGANGSVIARDSRTGSPIYGAEVRVVLQLGFWSEVAKGTTDEQGAFAFVPPRAGSYEAQALAIGYSSLPVSFIVDDCRPAAPPPNISAAAPNITNITPSPPQECASDQDCPEDKRCEA